MTPRLAVLLLAGLLVAALAAACSPADDPAVAPEPAADPAEPGDDDVGAAGTPADGAQAAADAEAPMLAELVEAGELPPLDERLPDNPLVVEPHERVGEYGGTWHSGFFGPADTGHLYRTVAYENLVRWDPEWTGVIPNIAERFESNDDATEFTFHLREGMRWSDGEPFDADDVIFWYDDVVTNEDITTGAYSGEVWIVEWMAVDNQLPTVEKVDDHTVVFRYETGNGLFLQHLASPRAAGVAAMPRHYLEQFHADYNPDIDQLVAEHGVNDWPELFGLKAFDDPRQVVHGLPVLRPWVMVTDVTDTQVVFERNPYYWKVDSDGNQLPYIDRVVFDVAEEGEVLLFKALNGEIDMHVGHFTELANKPVLADNRESGDYDFFDTIPSGNNVMALALNLTHKDPVLREVFQNRDFRIGLSHAIDRQEIIDVVYVSQGEPWQLAPRPESELHHERLATQYTQYDPDLANEHLDLAGYSERDSAGFRLGPDGERISFNVDVVGDQADRVDVLELVTGYWQAVGVEMRINTIDRSLFYVRKEDNDHDANVWGGGGGLDVILEPRWYFPSSWESLFAMAWAYHYLGNPGAEEPPEPQLRQMQLYRELLSTPDADEQNALMTEILDIAADEFHVMGIALPPDGYGIVKNNFHNVPERMPDGWIYPSPGPTNPEQYFISQ